ncbi:carboxylesterase family protein [Nonomuraea sediminis]|uniref:carboxylesterase family protein n=1 Tax=Nonomuraea sediminis TaxID=2835864 RepID=UPI001BDC1ECD|nr:carboxylesterase family protein [Nonomuraea sediminis]
MASGRLRGTATAFLGIPYASATRFEPPRPVPAWKGVRDAVAPGPAAPQPASRLERVMGPQQSHQAEDCLTLNVWRPVATGPRPVLVFLHGGGFATGSGGFDWYGGAVLAERGDMVVVTVNYRLGAMGYLHLPPVSQGNLGLLDQLQALRWVRANIAAFGGDPQAVTVAGQSGGALSILALLPAGEADGLFRRAILQSAPAGMPPQPPERAVELGRTYLELLDLAPAEAGRLRDLPVATLLAAQRELARITAGPGLAPPFQLVADGELVAADLVHEAGTRAGPLDILMGTTRDEAAAFFDLSEASERITDTMFVDPMLRLTRLRAERGNPVWLYRFDWHPAGSPYGACHCIELAFVFGDPAAWRQAPMLRGEMPPSLVAEVQRAWSLFVHGGDPGWERWPASAHHFVA